MVNLMELQMNSLNQNVNVMTDEQVETLRKQIAVYAVISEQLLQMHKNQNCTDMNSRHRWAPTPVQLQTMEQIFEAETECPSKEKIKEIVADLTKHGQISETNVYNWFQNRRARYKRKHQSSVNVESEVETEVDSDDKKIDEFCASQIAFDGSSNYLTGKMEAPESNHAYEPAGEHNTEDMAVSVSEIIGLGSTYSSCNLSRFRRRVNATSPNTTLVSSIIFPTRRKWSSVVVRAQNSSTYSSQKEDLVYVAKLVVGSFGGAGVIKYGSAIFPEITTPNLVLALVIISTPVLVAVLLLINQSLLQKS